MTTTTFTTRRTAFRRPRSLAAVPAVAAIAAAAGTAVASPVSTGDARHARTCAHGTFERAMRLAASQAADPGAAMLAMRINLMRSHACFAPDLTPEQLADILARYQALPPVIAFEGGLRFFTAGTVWSGDGGQSPDGRATRARLTYSFPPDGAVWDGQLNILNATLNNFFGGPANADRGKEYIRQVLANWRRHSGVTYQEVADDGSSRTNSVTRSPSRGDIRIGGNDIGDTGVLAYNYFPAAGGDMLINTYYFFNGNMANPGGNYRYLRNVVAHEHGHGLGYQHVVPCLNEKLMEPFISLAFDMLTIDERRGAGRNYGDRLSGNHTADAAYDLGDLASPAPRAVIERDLSTNGVGGAFGSGEDWFRFRLSTPQNVLISAIPTGGSYEQGAQIADCNGQTSMINASAAGNLIIELRDASGVTLLQSATNAGPGQTETLNTGVLPTGEYTIRIKDVGPNNNFTVQLYDLIIRAGDGSAKAPPQAIAGINKRCRANSNCFFMGDINSRPLEDGAVITSYAWDFDDDGVFEVVGPTPVRQYVSNGVHNVTLRVTDSNGQSATDTITVTIFGAETTLTGCHPFGGYRAATVPVTITGTNLKHVTSASMVTVSGPGVTVTGTPVPNHLGTEVTGLSFVIAPNAPETARNITVANADGTATLVGAFRVGVRGYYCPADWDVNDQINSNDISAFLSAWLLSVQTGSSAGDFNNDGHVNSNDISAFLSTWLNNAQFGC